MVKHKMIEKFVYKKVKTFFSDNLFYRTKKFMFKKMNRILTPSFDWIRFDEKNIRLESIRPASKNISIRFDQIRKQKHSIRNRIESIRIIRVFDSLSAYGFYYNYSL